MLDITRLERIRLTARPLVQRVIGSVMLSPNYHLFPGVKIRFENVERIPNTPVIFAMNHTDRYNYWPFQYHLWKQHNRFTATWVKGKYYENPMLGMFMEKTNNIPTVSRGYIIARDFVSTLDRRPEDTEYKALRALVNESSDDTSAVPPELLNRRRDILGRMFDPAQETWPEAIRNTFNQMTQRFIELNEEAQSLGLNTIIFPQGTRSIRLSKGHIGMAQIALHLKATIVPVGCNGCDKAYPGNSPWASKGNVVYRFGHPIPYETLSQFAPNVPFTPFSSADEALHREGFQALTDVVMDKINTLLDPEYQYDTNKQSDGETGSKRFL